MNHDPVNAKIPPNRPPYECLTEVSDDFVSLTKQIIEQVMEKDRRARDVGAIANLAVLLENKMDELTTLMESVPAYRDRASLIRQLEKCVENRDEVISGYHEKVSAAEASLARAIFQANKKLKKVNEAKKNAVMSEDVIKVAHQISKSYSVAAPLFWQQGDPFRPFPTEAEFRQSAIAAPRLPTAMPSIGQGIGASMGGRLSSPAQLGMSPRYSSQSPRASRPGAQTPGSWGRGQEASPSLQRRSSNATSPRRGAPGPPPLSQVEQMSSDSSSSSSSDEG